MNITRTRRIIMIVLIVLIATLILYAVPFPIWLNIDMEGHEILTDSTVINQGNIVIQGWRLNYLFKTDPFIPTCLTLPNIFFNVDVDNAMAFNEAPDAPCEWLTGQLYASDRNSSAYLSICFDQEEKWCFVRTSDVVSSPNTSSSDEIYRYFIASLNNDISAKDIMAICKDLIR